MLEDAAVASGAIWRAVLLLHRELMQAGILALTVLICSVIAEKRVEQGGLPLNLLVNNTDYAPAQTSRR